MLKQLKLRRFVKVSLVAAAIFNLNGPASEVFGQGEDKTVAVVNGTRISKKELDSSFISQIFPLEQQIYAIRKSALENLILRIVLDNEAKKRGVSIEELKRQMTNVKVDVPLKKVEEIYAEHASTFAAMNPEEAKERLRLDLESQERMRSFKETIAKFREDSKIAIFLEEPRLPLPEYLNAPSIGPEEAPIKIIEFSDFQCPYCKSTQNALKQVLRHYKDKVRLVFLHLPLDIHSEAFASAQAAVCAGEQGLFWQYHDALFASSELSQEVFKKLASNLSLDLLKFDGCLKSDKSRAAITNDVREANRLGIDSTPTFVINGRVFRGSRTFEEFKTAVELELNPLSGLLPLANPPTSLQERTLSK